MRAGRRSLRVHRPTTGELWLCLEPPGAHFPVFDSARVTLGAVQEGRARFGIPGFEGALGAGDAFVVPSGDVAMVSVDCCAPARLRLFTARIGAGPEASSAPLRGELGRQIARLVTSPVEDWDRLARLAADLLRSGRHGRPRSIRSAAVRGTVRAIEGNLARAESSAELANSAGISKFHLVHRFRDEVGVPPHAYRVYARISLARRLLAEGQSIAWAAVRCGFTDQSHLNHWFRRTCGLTPGEYARAWSCAPSAHPGERRPAESSA